MKYFRAVKIFFFIIAAGVFCLNNAAGQELFLTDNSNKPVLLVYDPQISQEQVRALATAIRHFNKDLTSVSSSQYSAGELKKYDFIFYAGAQDSDPAASSLFLKDLLDSYRSKTVCWINAGIRSFLDAADSGSVFKVEKGDVSYSSLEYKKANLRSGLRKPYRITVNNSNANRARVYGTFQRETSRTPFALNTAKFWYFSTPLINEDDYLVFCDILHLILAPESAGKKFKPKALIILSGINADSPADEIRNISRSFTDADFTFALGIEPVLYGKKRRFISQNPYLLRNIHSAAYSGSPVLVQSNFLNTEEQINAQINELIKNDIIPLGIIFKESLAVPSEEKLISHYSTIVKEGVIPFESYNEDGQALFFIRLKFPKKSDAVSYAQMYSQAQRMLVLRDALLGVILEPGFDNKEFLTFLGYLKQLGYEFRNLADTPNYVHSDQAVIFSRPDYYLSIPTGSIVYADMKMMELLKFELEDKYLMERYFSRSFEMRSEKVSPLRLKGTALLDLPKSDGVFLARQLEKRPGQLKKIQRSLLIFALGETSANPFEDVYSVIVICLFVLTFLVAFYFLWMLIEEIRIRKSYRGL